jgi:hypothetical protein
MNDMITFTRAVLRRFLTRERAEIGMAVCGLVALITPLLLWVSWSPNMLKGILVMGFASFLLATWFAQYACPEALDVDQEMLPKPGEIPASEAEKGDNTIDPYQKKSKK